MGKDGWLKISLNCKCIKSEEYKNQAGAGKNSEASTHMELSNVSIRNAWTAMCMPGTAKCPDTILNANLQSKVPSLRTSYKLSMSPETLKSSSVMAFIHSSDSCASSSLYLLFICNSKMYTFTFKD